MAKMCRSKDNTMHAHYTFYLLYEFFFSQMYNPGLYESLELNLTISFWYLFRMSEQLLVCTAGDKICCICNMGRNCVAKILNSIPFQLHKRYSLQRTLFSSPRLFAYLIILLVVCNKLASVSLSFRLWNTRFFSQFRSALFCKMQLLGSII